VGGPLAAGRERERERGGGRGGEIEKDREGEGESERERERERERDPLPPLSPLKKSQLVSCPRSSKAIFARVWWRPKFSS